MHEIYCEYLKTFFSNNTVVLSLLLSYYGFFPFVSVLQELQSRASSDLNSLSWKLQLISLCTRDLLNDIDTMGLLKKIFQKKKATTDPATAPAAVLPKQTGRSSQQAGA